jgi:hypothetical protein
MLYHLDACGGRPDPGRADRDGQPDGIDATEIFRRTARPPLDAARCAEVCGAARIATPEESTRSTSI